LVVATLGQASKRVAQGELAQGIDHRLQILGWLGCSVRQWWHAIAVLLYQCQGRIQAQCA
jgi:hypothetical protein